VLANGFSDRGLTVGDESELEVDVGPRTNVAVAPGKDSTEPEPTAHVRQFTVFSLLTPGNAGFERHSAFWAVPRIIADNLWMHGTCVSSGNFPSTGRPHSLSGG